MPLWNERVEDNPAIPTRMAVAGCVAHETNGNGEAPEPPFSREAVEALAWRYDRA